MLVAPNLRGDDISELQASLARIGFDPGHNDGIFGPDTAQALRDFQHNSGVAVDGVCGPSTVLALQVLTRQTGTGPGITAIRELETLRATARSLAELRVVVGQFGGLSSLVRQLVKVLRLRSATVVATDEPEASVQAATANRFRATAFVGFEVYGEPTTAVQYFSAPQFESTAGLQLAERICTALAAGDSSLNPELRGMRLQVLRETRMPAVLVSLSTADHALDHTPAVVDAIVDSLEAWVASGH